jgi:hypothetical protein
MDSCDKYRNPTPIIPNCLNKERRINAGFLAGDWIVYRAPNYSFRRVPLLQVLQDCNEFAGINRLAPIFRTR